METTTPKAGDVRFYKYPDRWGSPIEQATVIYAGDRACTVKVGAGQDTRTISIVNYMLFEFAQDAHEWAERQIKSVAHGIFGDYNERMIVKYDCDFKMKCPVVAVESGRVRYVVCEDVSNSMVLTDSLEAAKAVRTWLRKATGQRCQIRPVTMRTLPQSEDEYQWVI